MSYFKLVQASSHWALEIEATPLTLADSMSGCLSQIHGTTPAWSVTCLSIAAQAAGRCSFGSSSASSIALLMVGSLSCGQLELPWSRMFLPLNVGSSIV